MPGPAETRPPTPGRSRRANRQSEVTRAASEVFWRKGYRAASIKEVAESVGVLKGSLYYYIDSKEDLLWRIVAEVHEQSSAILDEVQALDVTPIERIRVFIARHIEWYLGNLHPAAVFFRESHHLTGERHQVMRQRRRGYEQVVTELFAAARDAGELAPGLDVRYATSYVMAAANAVPDWHRPSDLESAAHIARAYADMTVGLLTASPTG